MYAVLRLDYGEVGELVKVGIFQRISGNFRVLADILADIVAEAIGSDQMSEPKTLSALYSAGITLLSRIDCRVFVCRLEFLPPWPLVDFCNH